VQLRTKGFPLTHSSQQLGAASSHRLVIVADEHKIVERLGRFPLPVEVIPFAASPVQKKLGDRRTKRGDGMITVEKKQTG
jgi:ribose 5-phosphate isomerase A